MTPWCKEQIPVEGNFGQTYDKLSSSISKLSEQFTTNVVLKVQWVVTVLSMPQSLDYCAIF